MKNLFRCHPAQVSALAAFAILSAAWPAAAQEAAGLGVGTYKCGEATRAVRGDAELELMYFSWAQGWMTGWNLAQMNASLPIVDLNTEGVSEQRAFIKTYCANHPNSLYMDAARQLYESMRTLGK